MRTDHFVGFVMRRLICRLQDIDLDKIRVGLVSFANSVNVGEILFLDGLDGSTNEALVISAIGSQPDPVEDGKINFLLRISSTCFFSRMCQNE